MLEHGLAGARFVKPLARASALKLLGCALASAADDVGAWGAEPDARSRELHELLLAVARDDVDGGVRALAQSLLHVVLGGGARGE